MNTFSAKKTDIKQDWYLIDATNQNLGRLSTQIANLLMGKNKSSYTPNIVSGDVVVVINSSKVKVTGNKMIEKTYYKYSGYPGGLKETSLKDMLIKYPNRVIEHAVSGMLPKNKLRPLMLKNLKVYSTPEHKHSAQNPKEFIMESK